MGWEGEPLRTWSGHLDIVFASSIMADHLVMFFLERTYALQILAHTMVERKWSYWLMLDVEPVPCKFIGDGETRVTA